MREVDKEINTLNILVIGDGRNILTRQDIIDSGLYADPPEGINLVLDCADGTDFELTGIDGDEYLRELPDDRRKLLLCGGIGRMENISFYENEDRSHIAIQPKEQSWQQMNKGNLSKKQRRKL